MSTSLTWFEDPSAAAPPAEAAPVSGRVTVLPRLEGEGSAPRLVQEQRPRFEAPRPLGEGGLGVVVAANDLDIGRRVAIKRIRPEAQSRGAFLRFVQEVRTVGRLEHPNIVPIHDVGKDDQGGLYFVMKYVEGETLEAVIDRLKAGDRATHAAWSWERRLDVFLQILHAVDFAHERGVIHRDIKPANIMIGVHGEVQLLDWGVAKVVDLPDVAGSAGAESSDRSASVTRTRAGQLVGTPLYMSPEQSRGEPADPQVDTWALSMLWYELLTLSHPLGGLSTVEEVLEGVRSAPIPRPGRTPVHPAQGLPPAELLWIGHDGLDRDRARRYRTVREIIDRIERRNAGDFPVQCPVTFQKRGLLAAARLLDRHPVAVTSALAVVVLALAGIGVSAAVSIAAGALFLG